MRPWSALPIAVLSAFTTACNGAPCGAGQGAAVCSSAGDDAGAGLYETRSFSLPGGAIVEAQFGMKRGDSIDIDYSSQGGDVAWDIHQDDADGKPLRDQGRAAAGSFTFTAPTDGLYGSRWINDGLATLEIDVDFRGHGSAFFRGWL